MKLWLNRIVLFSFIFFSFSIVSQNVEELRKQRLKAAGDIENTAKLLAEKGNSKKSLLSNVSLLSSQISARQNIISNLSTEVSRLDSLLALNERNLASLNVELNVSKANYRSLIIRAYIHRSKLDNLMFILSSENVAIAYKRFKILKELSSYLKKQGESLVRISDEQKFLVSQIRINLTQKEDALETLNVSSRHLSKEKIAKELLIVDLEKEESWLIKELKRSEKLAKSLDDQIRAAIEIEAKRMAKANQKAYIATDFPTAKGRLLWPIDGGVVTSYFGEHDHPILKGIKVKNNGLDIEVVKGGSVKCVFQGVVSKVIAIPGYNMAVLIRHGNYLTVYANLSKVIVVAGQSILGGVVIGQLFADNDDARSTLHFEIWKESDKIDPILWLKK